MCGQIESAATNYIAARYVLCVNFIIKNWFRRRQTRIFVAFTMATRVMTT